MAPLDDDSSPPCESTARARLWIHAPNIHQGGGRTLLMALLESLAKGNVSERSVVTLDERLQIDERWAQTLQILRVAPTLGGRLRAEWSLATQARQDDLVLCFGNLPPLLPVRARVMLFLQNYYLIGGKSVLQLPIRLKTRLRLERLWLRSAVHRCHVVMVQSLTMQRQVLKVLDIQATVAPFVGAMPPRGDPVEEKSLDFLYVASGEPHKNHRQLIEAWIHLARQGTFPSLALTLDPVVHESLYTWIQEKASAHALRIKMLGTLSAAQLEKAYLDSHALIFPSLFESFGLPLIEAQAFDLPILASERDFVRDVISPVESFDPESSVSIARAVARHLHLPPDATALMTAQEFLNEVRSSAGCPSGATRPLNR